MEFLDKLGLSTLWNKVKRKVKGFQKTIILRLKNRSWQTYTSLQFQTNILMV